MKYLLGRLIASNGDQLSKMELIMRGNNFLNVFRDRLKSVLTIFVPAII
jgi:hypothetical protein